MFDGTGDWCKIWRKLSCTLKNDIGNLENFHRLTKSDFILESTMMELNQSKKSKQLDRSDPVGKLYFT